MNTCRIDHRSNIFKNQNLSRKNIQGFVFMTSATPVHSSQPDELPVDSVAQLVENCIEIAEVMGQKPVQACVCITAMISHVFIFKIFLSNSRNNGYAISTPTSEQYRGDGIGLYLSLAHGYCKHHKSNVPGGGCRGCAPLPEMTYGFLIQLVFCQKNALYWCQLRHFLVVHPLLKKSWIRPCVSLHYSASAEPLQNL